MKTMIMMMMTMVIIIIYPDKKKSYGERENLKTLIELISDTVLIMLNI